jgi:hypothetical protein
MIPNLKFGSVHHLGTNVNAVTDKNIAYCFKHEGSYYQVSGTDILQWRQATNPLKTRAERIQLITNIKPVLASKSLHV